MIKRRVLVVGFDGGSWRVLEPMMANGTMPRLKKLVRRGTKGTLRSTLPPITPVAWSTFHTGCSPGRHGIFDFSGTTDHGRHWEFVNSTTIKKKTLWRYLSERGQRVGVVNVPMTYPPAPVNGCIVTGLFTPGLDADFTYPSSLKQQLLSAVPGYDIVRARGKGAAEVGIKNVNQFVDRMIELVENRTKAALHLMDWLVQWDLFMVQFQSVDRLQHLLWPLLDVTCRRYNARDFQEVSRFYAALDGALGQLCQVLTREDLVVILSDHGFQRHDKTVLINNWLHREGFLFHTSKRSHRLASLALDGVRGLDILQLRRRLVGKSRRSQAVTFIKSEKGIDWVRTKAIGIAENSHALIYVQGDIADRETIRNELKSRLTELTDPDTGYRVVEDVVEGGEQWPSGDESDRLIDPPDMLLIPIDHYAFRSSWDFQHTPIFRRPEPDKEYHLGIHDMDGILVLNGEGIKPGHTLQAALMDITPTLVYALGLPIPTYMEGNVIEDGFEPGHFALQPIEYQQDSGESDDEIGHSADTHEKAAIEERLKNLGYL